MAQPERRKRRENRIRIDPYELANEYSRNIYLQTKGFDPKRVDRVFKSSMREIIGKKETNQGVLDDEIKLPSQQSSVGLGVRRPTHPLFRFKPEWLKNPSSSQPWSRQIVEGLLDDDWLQEMISESLNDKKDELEAFTQDMPLIEKFFENTTDDVPGPEEIVTEMEGHYMKPLMAKVLLDAITAEKDYLTTLYTTVQHLGRISSGRDRSSTAIPQLTLVSSPQKDVAKGEEEEKQQQQDSDEIVVE
jgi:hypothetical protein